MTDHPSHDNQTQPGSGTGPDADLERLLNRMGEAERSQAPTALAARVAASAAQRARAQADLAEPKPRRLLFPVAIGGLAMAAAIAIVAAVGLGWLGTQPAPTNRGGDAAVASAESLDAELDAWLDALDSADPTSDDAWGLAVNVSSSEPIELSEDDLWSSDDELLVNEVVF